MSEEDIEFRPGLDEAGEVILLYRCASSLKPGDAQMHFDYGLSFMELGTGIENQAIGAFEEAVRLRPHWAAAHSQLGLTYAAADRREETIEAFKRAISLRPDDLDTLGAFAHACLLLEHYSEAEQAAARMVTLAPLMSGSHFVLGFAQLLTGRYAEAGESFHRAVQLEPDLSEARFGLGLASIALGDDRLAQVQYDTLRELDHGLAQKLAEHRQRGRLITEKIVGHFLNTTGWQSIDCSLDCGRVYAAKTDCQSSCALHPSSV